MGKKHYLIRKGGYWYRPNSQGYTSCTAEAGRYSLDDATRLTHPNGPRDGLSYVHKSELPTFTLAVRIRAAVKAFKAPQP